jgi:hypothetical protein
VTASLCTVQFVVLSVTTVSQIFFSATRFLGAFAKFEKATTSFVLSVRPSVCPSAWNSSAPSGRILMKFGVSVFSKNSRENSSLIKI